MIRIKRFGALKDRSVYGASIYSNQASDGQNFSGSKERIYVGFINDAIVVRRGQSISPDYTMGVAQESPLEPYSSGVNEQIAVYFKKSKAFNIEKYERGMIIAPFKENELGPVHDPEYEIKSIDLDATLPISDFNCAILAEKRT